MTAANAVKRPRFSLPRWISAAPHMAWCVLFIVAPLLFICYYACTDPETGHLTLSNLANVFRAEYLRILWRSVEYALIATAVCLLIAYPLALCITRMKQRHQSMAILLLMLPMWINLLIRTYSLKNLLESNGLINQFLGLFGIGPVPILGTGFAIVLGLIYNYLPYMVLPIYSVLSKMDRRLIEAASDLGCSPLATLWRVVLPLSVSGIISGITMVFVPSISTFFISSSLSDGTILLIGDVIEKQISLHTARSYSVGASLSFILMILILVSLFITNRFGDKQEGVVL